MNSIRQRLTLTLAAGFCLLLGAGGVAVYGLTRAALVREFDHGLHARAVTIMSLTEENNGGLQVEFPGRFQHELTTDSAPLSYAVWVAKSNHFMPCDSFKETTLPCRFGAAAAPEYWNQPLAGGVAGRAIGIEFAPKIEDEDRVHREPLQAVVVVAADRRGLDRTLGTLAAVLLSTGALIIAAMIPMVRLTLARGHAPLAELAGRAAAISAATLQSRFPHETMPEELQPITARLNDLLGRLEASFERERRFSADLAHELRTPLAELRAHAEVELQFATGAEVEKHRETLEIALQMEAFVTRLLELVRGEQGRLIPRAETVPLPGLVAAIASPLAAKLAGKKINLQVEIPDGIEIQTDCALLRSILTNLLANAAEYSPPGSRIRVFWNASQAELAISNPAPDLEPGDLGHLFERLWRKDKSRTGGDHFGMGLALSRAFAEALGMQLSASLDGVELTLTLKTAGNNTAAKRLINTPLSEAPIPV